MPRPREIELKLEVPPDRAGDLATLPLLKRLKPNKIKTVRSVYFDTKRRKLHKHGLTLRIRQIDGRTVQTIKQQRGRGVGLFERDEWESDIDGQRPDLDAARATALAPFLSNKLRHNLRPVFETRVRRQIFPLNRSGSKIELALDNGEIETGGRSIPLCEIELELKDGEPVQLFEMARALGGSIPATPAVESKAARGYALVAREAPTPVKAEPIVVGAKADWAAAFAVVARSCLYQIAANQPALVRGNTQAIHQMRVGIRRLRAAIWLFKEILPGPSTDAMKTELKWLAGELGAARELDVFIRRVVRPATKRKADGPDMDAIAKDFHCQFLQAVNRAKEAVSSARFRNFELNAVAWIETGDWMCRNGKNSDAPSRRVAVDCAAGELRRLYREIRKQGRKLAELDARSRHKFRIKAKKLRYACEFFAGTFSGAKKTKRRVKFIAKLKELQDALGDLNDIVVHQGLAKTVVQSPSASEPPRGSGKLFTAGRLSGREGARFNCVMQDAKKAYRKLAKARPFWT